MELHLYMYVLYTYCIYVVIRIVAETGTNLPSCQVIKNAVHRYIVYTFPKHHKAAFKYSSKIVTYGQQGFTNTEPLSNFNTTITSDNPYKTQTKNLITGTNCYEKTQPYTCYNEYLHHYYEHCDIDYVVHFYTSLSTRK